MNAPKSCPFYLSVFLFLILFSSCGSARFNKMRIAAKEESPEMFIQNTKKEIIPVHDFKKVDYDSDTIVAIQNSRSYSRIDKKEEYIRVLKGKMNLYYNFDHYMTTTYSTPTSYNPSGWSQKSRTRLTRYFDLGPDQPLIYLTRQSLGENMTGCSTCQEVLHQYDQKRKGLKWWKYGNWAAIGGGLILAFTGGDDTAAYTDLKVYSFAGLFFGGLFSEFYRLTRVGKNEFAIEDAIVKYNQFTY